MIDILLISKQRPILSSRANKISDPRREVWRIRSRKAQVILEDVDQSASDPFSDVLERMIQEWSQVFEESLRY